MYSLERLGSLALKIALDTFNYLPSPRGWYRSSHGNRGRDYLALTRYGGRVEVGGTFTFWEVCGKVLGSTPVTSG